MKFFEAKDTGLPMRWNNGAWYRWDPARGILVGVQPGTTPKLVMPLHEAVGELWEVLEAPKEEPIVPILWYYAVLLWHKTDKSYRFGTNLYRTKEELEKAYAEHYIVCQIDQTTLPSRY